MRSPFGFTGVAASLLLASSACFGPKVTGKPVPGAGTRDLRIAVNSKSGPELQKQVETALVAAAIPNTVIVARAEQEAVVAEATHQISGLVSSDTAVAVGEQLGANLLLVVEETASRNIPWPAPKSRYAVRVTAVDPESGAIVAMAEADVVGEQVSAISCDFACARENAVNLAVGRLLRDGT